MNNRTPAEVFPPGEFIRDELEERGWTQADLAKILDRSVPVVNEIITGKTALTLDTARQFAVVFETSPEYWMNLEIAYRKSLAPGAEQDDGLRTRARLYKIAPVKDMERRNWIRATQNAEELEDELRRFYGVVSVDEVPQLRVAARASVDDAGQLTPEQIAWCVQACRLARGIQVAKFSNTALDAGIPKLRALAAYPEDVRKVPSVLAEMGIRFLVVEHLPHTRIDGAALWLDENEKSPVVVLSMRYDRINYFWHTLCHELSHVKHHDQYTFDDALWGPEHLPEEARSEVECRANEEAAAMLVPREKLQSFMVRVSPFFSKQRIIQFARTIGVHPGIVAGQLQYIRKNYAANSEMLVKVRDILIGEALTDGWGRMVIAS